jgi:hypothetical protein
MASARSRRQVERTLVGLAVALESSPTLWSVDPSTSAVTLSGHRPEEVEAALAAIAPDAARFLSVCGSAEKELAAWPL